MAAYPRSEEQLNYPGQMGDNGQAASIIGQNTDRTVNQFQNLSEENAANIRHGMDNMAQGVTNAYQGYRQGRSDAYGERAQEQKYQLGQQEYQLGQQEYQQNAGNLEEQGMNLRALHRHEDYLQGSEEGHAQNRGQEMEGTRFQHDTKFMPQMDQASLRAQEASTAASGSATRMNEYNLAAAKRSESAGFAADDLQQLVAQKDQLERTMQSGPPDAQTSAQLQAVTSQLEQKRSYWAAKGLDANYIAHAEKMARVANMQGQQASDVTFMLSHEGQNANALADDVEQKTHGLQQAQQYANQFHQARSGSEEEAQAYHNLTGILRTMGPEGQAAAQHIQEGDNSAFGLSGDTSGLHTTGGRIDNALAQFGETVKAQHASLVNQYGQAPSNGFRGRVQRIGGAVGQMGTTGGPVDLMGGGSGGMAPGALDKNFIQGNRSGPAPIQQPSAPTNAAAGYGQQQAPVWERRRAEQQKTHPKAHAVHQQPGASPFRPGGQ